MTLQVGSGSGSEINSCGSATLNIRVPVPELLYGIGVAGGDDEETAEVVLEILVLHGGEALQVQLHPHVEPGREAGRVQRMLLEMFGHHVALRAVLFAHAIQQQLLIDQLLRVLLKILQAGCRIRIQMRSDPELLAGSGSGPGKDQG